MSVCKGYAIILLELVKQRKHIYINFETCIIEFTFYKSIVGEKTKKKPKKTTTTTTKKPNASLVVNELRSILLLRNDDLNEKIYHIPYLTRFN